MKLALCQLDPVWEDKLANKDKIKKLLSAKEEPFDWLIFPEMTLSSFSMSKRTTTLDPKDNDFFRDIARARNAFISFGGVRDGFNQIITLDREGREVSAYSKIHLFTRLAEQKTYKAGREAETFKLDGAMVSPAVCFDLRFSYLFWDLAEMTDIYVVIACWPTRRKEHWATLLKARAIENQAFMVGVNRTGRDPDFEFSGLSAVYDPMGEEVFNAGSEEGIYLTDIDLSLVSKTRDKLAFLRDRKSRLS